MSQDVCVVPCLAMLLRAKVSQSLGSCNSTKPNKPVRSVLGGVRTAALLLLNLLCSVRHASTARFIHGGHCQRSHVYVQT